MTERAGDTWLDIAAARGERMVRVSVVAVAGSAPREVGAGLSVWSAVFAGTIGGGALEMSAIERARGVLGATDGSGKVRACHDYPLGPQLGQCCGGYVTLMFEVFEADDLALLAVTGDAGDVGVARILVRPIGAAVAPVMLMDRRAVASVPPHVLAVGRTLAQGAGERCCQLIDSADGARWFVEPLEPARLAVFIYGAGHCGRALVRALQPLPFDVTWVDVAAARFPDDVADGVKRVVTADVVEVARGAVAGAMHVIMTFSHALDEDLARVLLERGDGLYVGVIGSETKAARFRQRLARSGLPTDAVARLQCPIGVPGLPGKEPAVIAASVAAELLMRAAECVVSARRTSRQKTL